MSGHDLQTEHNLGTRTDDIYAALIAAHEGLSEPDSSRLNVRLVLLLANHVGDAAVLLEAIAKAKAGLDGGQSGTTGAAGG